jgi:hypothetical protein
VFLARGRKERLTSRTPEDSFHACEGVGECREVAVRELRVGMEKEQDWMAEGLAYGGVGVYVVLDSLCVLTRNQAAELERLV